MANGINTITKARLADGREVAFVDWSDQPIWSTGEYEHGATQRELDLFQYTVGDQVPAAAAAGAAATRRIANERDTNMAAPGSMASTEEFLVYAIKPEIFMLYLDTANDFTDWDLDAAGAFSGYPLPTPICIGILNLFLKLHLEISQKRFANAAFGYFNSGFGVYTNGGGALLTNAAGRSYAGPGEPGQHAVRSFNIGQHIGGQEKFRVTLTNANGDALEIGNPETAAQNLGGGAGSANTYAMARIHIYLDGLHKRPVG